MTIVEMMFEIAANKYGVVFSVLGGILFGCLAFMGGSLTHGVPGGVLAMGTITAKGVAFGMWAGYTPFALWAIVSVFFRG